MHVFRQLDSEASSFRVADNSGVNDDNDLFGPGRAFDRRRARGLKPLYGSMTRSAVTFEALSPMTITSYSFMLLSLSTFYMQLA
jgi:hypothetical protein